MTEFAAIILAAGKGTRMKSDRHKVLHPIAGKPMLEHLLDEFAALDPERTVVVVGDRRAQIDAALAGREVATALQDPQLGTAHAALQARAMQVAAEHGRSEASGDKWTRFGVQLLEVLRSEQAL